MIIIPINKQYNRIINKTKSNLNQKSTIKILINNKFLIIHISQRLYKITMKSQDLYVKKVKLLIQLEVDLLSKHNNRILNKIKTIYLINLKS